MTKPEILNVPIIGIFQLMPYLVLDILQNFEGMAGLFVASAYSGTLR